MPQSALADPASFWDPRRRPEKPDLRGFDQIRFLTEDEFPPFNFAGAGGALEGFNVDIARAICAELALPCTIQARRFDTIIDALEAGEGDAIIAALAATPVTRQRLRFSDPYFRMPGRFAARRDAAIATIDPAALRDRRIAVVAGSAHEAFIADFFPGAVRVTRQSQSGAREALAKGAADLLFADGVGLSFWLNGETAQGCCRFIGGPYLESRYFGEGISIAYRRDDEILAKAIDHALFRLWESGVYADLVRRWFPLDPFEAVP